jgi:hypothetical protein
MEPAITSQIPPVNFRPKPLSIAQENCVDALIQGRSEREVAEALGIDRGTIAEWRKSPLFVATLNQRRQALWRESHERLRSLILKGLTQLESRIETMTNRELLQLVGLYATLGEPTGETDAGQVAARLCSEALAREGMKPNMELDRLSKKLLPTDPAFERRKAEIEDALRTQYGESEDD